MIREVIETIRPDQPFDAMRSVRVIVSPDLMDTDNIRVQDKNVTIEENGLTVVTPDIGYQGLGEVQITTNVPEKRLKTETVTINSNSYQEIYPGEGYDGFSSVTIETNVPSSVNNQNKTVVVESNGFQQVLPDTGYSGIGELNLTVNVPTPVIQDDSVRFIEASNEARQVIVRPDTGFDALEKVTLNIASATLARNQNILTLSNAGIFNLPSVANSNVLGFADSCTVTVNGDINKTTFRYISLYSGSLENIPPAAIIDLERDTFSGSTSEDVRVELQEGRSLCIITVYRNKVDSVQIVGNRTGTGETVTIDVSKNKYYREINYDIGQRVYLKNDEGTAIISSTVHAIPNKLMVETDLISLGVNFISSSDVTLTTV